MSIPMECAIAPTYGRAVFSFSKSSAVLFVDAVRISRAFCVSVECIPNIRSAAPAILAASGRFALTAVAN